MAAGESIVGILDFAIDFWNQKWAQITLVVTDSPQTFNSTVWDHMGMLYNDIVLPIGTALTSLFFIIGFIKACSNWADRRAIEQIIKPFVRLIMATWAILNGFSLASKIIGIAVSIANKILFSGVGAATWTLAIPDEVRDVVGALKFWRHPIQSTLCLIIALIGMCVILALAIMILITVYGRFFKLYMYLVLMPLPLSTFAGEPTHHIGMQYAKGFVSVCMEGASMAVACVVFALLMQTLPEFDVGEYTSYTLLLAWLARTAFHMFLLSGTIKAADQVTQKIVGV